MCAQLRKGPDDDTLGPDSSRNGFSSKNVAADRPMNAFNRIAGISARYGITSPMGDNSLRDRIRACTADTIKETEVLSLKADKEKKKATLMAYACAKARKEGALRELAIRIIDEEVARQKAEIEYHKRARAARHCVVQSPPAESTPEQIDNKFTTAKTELHEALNDLADLCESAGTRRLGLVVVEHFAFAYGVPKTAKLHVVGTADILHLDIVDKVKEDAALVSSLAPHIGEIQSASLKISFNNGQGQPAIRFEVSIWGHAGMKEGGPVTTFMGSRDSLKPAATRRSLVADMRQVCAKFKTPALERDCAYAAGAKDGEKCFDLSPLLPNATKPWLADKQFVLVVIDKAIVVADVGPTPLQVRKS